MYNNDNNNNKPNRYRERRFTNKFRKLVLDLEDEMEMLEMCYKKNQVYQDLGQIKDILGQIKGISGQIKDILGHLMPLYTDILICSDEPH